MQMDFPYHATKAANIAHVIKHEISGITQAFSYITCYFKEMQLSILYIKMF